jgi:hypothetical protein
MSTKPSTLAGRPACVDSKRLAEQLSPLDATLTKNRGGGPKSAAVAALFRGQGFCAAPSLLNKKEVPSSQRAPLFL